jgi:tetratricopeptide (TPR) repeat protein
MPLLRLLIALTLVLVTARVASADEPDVARARLHFERGEKLYALARFNDALGEYQAAFDAKPLPAFLFNIAQCYRNLADYGAAVFSFRKYLQLAPAAPNREQVEQLISELETKRDRAPAPPLTVVHSPTTEEPHQPLYTKWWFWTAIAVVGTAGGVTIYEASKSTGPPATDLGNILFGR